MQTKIYEDRYTLETYVNLMKRDWLLENYMLTEEQLGCEVEHLTFDSQDVKPGTLFVVKGVHFKAQYLKDAIDRGAFCYISERVYTEEEIGPAANTCGVILVHDIRRAMASLGNLFYEEPWRELNLIGITGTKGKSTTTYFLRQILDLWAE